MADDSAAVSPVTPDVVPALCELAAAIWRQHYPGIITVAQIEYMLAQRYNPAVIRAELERENVWWDQLSVAGRVVGFSSYFLTDTAGEMKLDKLYLDQGYRRRGLGGRLLEHAAETARSRACRTLMLAVNKHNTPAIAAYRKYGFRVVEAVVKDIGGGFVMDDYVMSRDL